MLTTAGRLMVDQNTRTMRCVNSTFLSMFKYGRSTTITTIRR